MLILMCLISCLFGFANVQPIDQLQNQVNNVQEVKQRKDIYTEGEYLAISISEMCNYDFLSSAFKDSPSFFTNTQIGATYSMFSFVSDSKLAQCSYANASNMEYAYNTSGLSIDSWVYTLVDTGSSATYFYRIQVWELYLLHDSLPTLSQTIRFKLFYNDSSSNTSFLYSQIVDCDYSTTSAQNYVVVSKNNDLKDVYLDMSVDTDSYNSGYYNGHEVGYDEGYSTGYQNGYGVGYSEGINLDSTAVAIFTGIVEVGLLPVNVFLLIFNYEVFGINIAGLISGLITIAMVMIILRFLFGGKQNVK